MHDETIAETAPENPAAFPVAHPIVTDMYGREYGAGMTLRDWFAGQALSGLPLSPIGSSEVEARAAYMIADAMLRERSK